ncbi:MAG: FAD-dependent monooxygenase [Pseudomonadota bacterium]
MSSTQTDSKIALISGAGPAGLTAALLLEKQGWQPIVIERDAELRGGGFLVSIADAAYTCMQELGLLERLAQRSSGITKSVYYNASDRALLELQTKNLFGHLPVLQLMRDDLTQVLYDVARERVEICMDTQISHVQQQQSKVSVTLNDGQVWVCDLLIGADGVHSNTRNLTFNKEHITEHYLDLHCAAFRHNNICDLENCFETHTQQNRYMATFTTGQTDVGSVFVWADRSRIVPDNLKARLTEAFSGSQGTTLDHLSLCPDGNFYYDVLKQIELPKWYCGRVVLLGDAAHCLTLFSGRGAAAAINDARVLVEAISKEQNLEAGLANYDRTLRPNLTSMQSSTRRDVRWYVPATRINLWLRNNGFRWVPNAFFHRYFQNKYASVS